MNARRCRCTPAVCPPIPASIVSAAAPRQTSVLAARRLRTMQCRKRRCESFRQHFLVLISKLNGRSDERVCVASQMNINRAHVSCGRSGMNESDALSMALRFTKLTDFNIRSGYLCSIHHRDVRQRLGSIILISSHPARRQSGRKSPFSERNIRKLMDSAKRGTSATDLRQVIRNAE